MNKLRVGCIGCGEATQILHLPSLQQLSDRFEVTALCDVSRKVVDQLGDRWNIQKRYTDERDMLAQDDVDIVLIASPNHYHATSALQALEAGKHVLVEKPMCITLREADEIIAATKRTGKTVQVAYMRRYATAFEEAKSLVQAMGGIRFTRVHDIIGRNAMIIEKTSTVIRGTDITDDVKAKSKAAETALFDEALGAGAPPEIGRSYGMLLGLASHDVSAMRELIGVPKGTLYAANKHGGNYISAAFDYGDFVCHLEIGVDGIPRYETYIQVYGHESIVRVQYDTPYVRNMPTRLMVTSTDDGGRIAHVDENPSWSDNFTLEWRALYDNITQKRAPKSSPEDFHHDLELFLGMIALMR